MQAAADLARAALLGSLPLVAALGVLSVSHLYTVALAKGICDVVFKWPTRRTWRNYSGEPIW